jgi:outer membrane receptor protein involved in Fe transport
VVKSTAAALFALLFIPLVAHADPAPEAPPSKSKLGERLIYSVDRTPEAVFETPRGVTIIGRDDLMRKNGFTLSDILMEEVGFTAISERNGQATPIMRGLIARHVLVLVDGVKINNSLWRTNTVTKEQLNLIDVSQIERIEIVRGVVSVLGTEALGGVVNIITRRGPASSEDFGGTIGLRVASADRSFMVPVDVWGRIGNSISYHAGGSFQRLGDLEAGGKAGRQPFTSYSQQAAHANVQFALSAEKDLTFAYQTIEQNDLKFWQSLVPESNVKYEIYPIEPIAMRMATAAYQDLTARPWADALAVNAYWNEQKDGTRRITAKAPQLSEFAYNIDRMTGLNLEGGKFLGSHHFLFGMDLSEEKIRSATETTNLTTGDVARTRGRYTDGARYRSGGIYLNDKFSVTRFATVAAGVRYVVFQTEGKETVPLFGEIDLGSTRKDATTALNVTFHAAPGLNVIAGWFRGFRAPGLDDMSKYFLLGNRTTVEIPNPSMSPERVNSIEAGLKYEGRFFSASAFYFDNELTDVIVRGPSTLNGLSFIDSNGDGKQQAGEPSILQNRNLGQADIDGLEVDLRITPVNGLLIFGNFAQTRGIDELTGLTLPYIQPEFGTAGVRVSSSRRWAPWAELSMRYASSSVSMDGNATVIDLNNLETSAGFRVYTLRAGASVGRFILSAAAENLTDEQYSYFRYKTLSSYMPVYQAGRQLVLGVTYKF